MNQGNKIIYEFGDFQFDVARRRLFRKDGEILQLPAKAFEVLRVLIEGGGETIDKDELMNTVWADTIVEESNLTQTIYILRKALGENAAGQHYIQTLPKRGYRFIGQITNAGERRNDVARLAKIAVLPFENRSGDDELEYLADGLSENLIDSLSQFPQIGVIARSSAFRYKGATNDPQQIFHALGAKFILEGRVTRRGEKTLIRAELVDVAQEVQMWGKTIECRVCDLQEIKSEIVQNVVEKLALDLTAAQKKQIGRPITFNDEAYQIYLSGLFLYRKGGLENTLKALELYDKATELDPDFGFAYALKPAIYAFLAEGYMNQSEAFEKARIAADLAMEKGAELPQTHIAAAIIKKWELDLAGAERDYLRTFDLNPNNSSAHNNYALILSARGKHRAALAEIEIAAQLDPLFYYLDINKAWILTNDGRFDEALEILRNLVEQHPDLKLIYGFISAAYEGKTEHRRAIEASRETLGAKELYAYGQADIAYNLFKLGEIDEARQISDKLRDEKKSIPPVKLAGIYEIEKKRELALQTLETAYAARDPELHSLYTDPRLRPLHDEPRFQALLKKIGLIG